MKYDFHKLLSTNKAVYVRTDTEEKALQFLQDSENQGFLFSDGSKPTDKNIASLFRILNNKTICYVGAIGHMRYQADTNIIKVEY